MYYYLLGARYVSCTSSILRAEALMKKKSELPLVGGILQKLAPQIGAHVLLEPEWNVAGQITFANGRRRYFRFSTLDLNPVGSADIAKDKDYAAFFMGKMGYPIITGKTFFSNEFAQTISPERNMDGAWEYAQSLGLPVIVKPNSGSQGAGVSLVHTKRQFYRAMRAIFKKDRVALVQTPVTGKDYRVVVLDDAVISAYERIPLHVVGNGTSNIYQLLEEKQDFFEEIGRDTNIKMDDPRIQEKLQRGDLSLESVPVAGERIQLLDNANLSSGGESIDVTDVMHPDLKKMAIALTRDMGLRICGVDLMIQGDISHVPEKYWIIEINAAPGLDHYAKSGPAQQQIVEDLYLQVLKSMEH